MRTLCYGIGALIAVCCVSTTTASAQLDTNERRCVSALHKDGLKVASSHAKQVAACLSGAQKGTVTDFAGCVAAEPNDSVEKSIAKGDADASKSCGLYPPAFGLPAAFDDTISEAGIVHARGLLTDLFGSPPTVAGDKDGNKCQAAALKAAQLLVSAYGRGFVKCAGSTLEDGAIEDADLLDCLSPDVAKYEDKLAGDIATQCDGVSPATALAGACSGESAATLADCIASRARCRACRQAATNAALDADCDLVDDLVDNNSCSFTVTLSGNAIHFSEFTRVEGAEIWVLEHPEMTDTTDVDGYFEFPDLLEGEEATLVLEHPDFHPIQNGTVRLGAAGAERVTFQAVTWDIYDLLADFLDVVPDEINKCQMVTTVTRVGKSIYDLGAHGEEGVRVSISPELPEEHGPIYFNSLTVPQYSLFSTSDDGGALYIQVPPGDYVWTAHKGFDVYTRIKSKCRAGLLVNASPPWGLQKH